MMKWKSWSLIVVIGLLGLFVACQNIPVDNVPLDTVPIDKEEAEPMSESEPTVVEPEPDAALAPLPERSGPRVQTTGSVPHVQILVQAVPEVNDELYRRAFSLPDVENRPTIVSLPGADGMWLSDGAPVVRPKVIVNGREFAHIHPDGSLHAPLPYERALEAAEKGWAERHPWADQRDGWEGFVMLFTPQSMEELDVTFQLIVESYNHVTGRTVQVSDFSN
ncbi:MAG: luciferase family protein [Chloroflexota bacterium]